jgi:hypothetical protein
MEIRKSLAREKWIFKFGANGMSRRTGIFCLNRYTKMEIEKYIRKSLREYAFKNFTSGYTEDRVHMTLEGTGRAFCGAKVNRSPNTRNAYSEHCGNCNEIEDGLIMEFGNENEKNCCIAEKRGRR